MWNCELYYVILVVSVAGEEAAEEDEASAQEVWRDWSFVRWRPVLQVPFPFLFFTSLYMLLIHIILHLQIEESNHFFWSSLMYAFYLHVIYGQCIDNDIWVFLSLTTAFFSFFCMCIFWDLTKVDLIHFFQQDKVYP